MPIDIADHLSSLEQDPFWQATVTNEQGHLGVVMRGHLGAPYETGYYIEPERRYPYVLKGITDLFSSGKLRLVKGSIPTTENPPKPEQMRALLESRGWKAEYEWQMDGWHFALTSRPDQPRNIVIFEREVFDDWTAQEILHRLEDHNWEMVVGTNQGKNILYYSNRGFRLKAA
jgi:hypothetical protein